MIVGSYTVDGRQQGDPVVELVAAGKLIDEREDAVVTGSVL